jgi:hypothetical protein
MHIAQDVSGNTVSAGVDASSECEIFLAGNRGVAYTRQGKTCLPTGKIQTPQSNGLVVHSEASVKRGESKLRHQYTRIQLSMPRAGAVLSLPQKEGR